MVWVLLVACSVDSSVASMGFFASEFASLLASHPVWTRPERGSTHGSEVGDAVVDVQLADLCLQALAVRRLRDADRRQVLQRNRRRYFRTRKIFAERGCYRLEYGERVWTHSPLAVRSYNISSDGVTTDGARFAPCRTRRLHHRANGRPEGILLRSEPKATKTETQKFPWINFQF